MSITVAFDKAKLEYYPGDAISGYVHVQTKEPQTIRKIAIKFKGEIKTHWTETETNSNNENETISYDGFQKLFDYGIILLGGSGQFQLQPGNYSYRFEYLLPNNLPVNWEGFYGSVRYKIKAFIDIPLAFDISCKETFKIIPIVNLNNITLAKRRFLIEKQKNLGVLCCISGNITMTVTAPISGFICSDVIPFYVQIENNSAAEIYETDIRINKNVIYKSTSPSGSHTETNILVVRTWKIEVASRGGKREFKAPIQLILTEPSTIDDTLIIRIIYVAEVTCKIRGMHTNLRGSLPIIIGNIPMEGYDNGESSIINNLSASTTLTITPSALTEIK